MSTIYLLRKEQPNGVSYLTLVTREQWLSVVRRERNRFFIRDCIFDCGHMDCILLFLSSSAKPSKLAQIRSEGAGGAGPLPHH